MSDEELIARDAPDRIWVQWPHLNGAGLAFTCQARPPALRHEYIRANLLNDPIAVHSNMLRGTIAKPTVEQIIHLYGVDALVKALAPVIVQEAQVNETPKSEHDASDVLSPAANGDA